MKVIYLDNNATTQCTPEVVEAMLPYFSEKYGNASSMHTFGGSNRHIIDASRKQMADFLGAAYADEIIFTSCATESDNTAIFSAARSFPGKKHIITSAVEHPAAPAHPLHMPTKRTLNTRLLWSRAAIWKRRATAWITLA